MSTFNYRKGDKITVVPSGSAIDAPASKWLIKEQEVELLDDAFSGGWDVFDVKLADGTEESIYGFNIKNKYTVGGEIYNVKECRENCGIPDSDSVDPRWYEYNVWLMDEKGNIVEEWDSYTETYNGMQKLTEARATESVQDVIDFPSSYFNLLS